MLFAKKGADPAFPAGDRGTGQLRDYTYDLRPANRRVVIRLAGSGPHQELIELAAEAEQLETAIPRRTAEDERTDAEMPVRVFADGRVLGPLGRIPRGLEAAVNETLSRLDIEGRKQRIPVEIVKTRQGLRVDLRIGETL